MDGYLPVYDQENTKRLLGYVPVFDAPHGSSRVRVSTLPPVGYMGDALLDLPPTIDVVEFRIEERRTYRNKGWSYTSDKILVTDVPLDKLRMVVGWRFPGENPRPWKSQ